MTKIISIKGEPISAPGEKDDNVVKMLERFTDMARNGEISGFGIVVIKTDSSFATDWRHQGTRGAGHTLAAGVLCLQHRVASSMAVDPDEP
jgi:hypothetical protein